MSVDLSRQELYDLVWSTPMMHAAKGLGISDVMLGKICKERNVPRPPRGYWANLSSTSAKKLGHFFKPPLPNFTDPTSNFDSFIHNEYEVRNDARTDDFDPRDLNDPIKDPPPPFTEGLDDFRKRIEASFPELTAPEEIITPHAIVQKLIAYDATLAAIRKRDRWAEDPKYQNEKGKMYLHWLNVLVSSFEFLGFDVSVRGKKHFTFHVTILGHHKEFVAFINEHNPTIVQRKYHKKTQSKTYCFRWDKDSYEYTRGSNYYEFEVLTVDCIKQIVMDLVVADEKYYRDRIFSNYLYNVERRKQEIELRELELKVAAQKKRKALERLLQSREDLMTDAVVSMNRADQIRELIAVMQAKSHSAKQPVKDMERWVRWATHQANTIDPRYMSVVGFEAWIGKFRLKH